MIGAMIRGSCQGPSGLDCAICDNPPNIETTASMLLRMAFPSLVKKRIGPKTWSKIMAVPAATPIPNMMVIATLSESYRLRILVLAHLTA